jgi:hypothetical protein
MYWSSNSHSTKVKIRKQSGAGVWSQHTNSNNNVASWPGHLYLPFSTIAFHPSTTSTGHYRTVHIDFQPNWSSHAQYGSNNINLSRMQIWGGYPAGKRTIYSVDSDQNVDFPAAVEATSFRKAGGGEIINSSGEWVGSDQGIKGQKGEVGQKGQTGAKGITGSKGQKGEIGAKGINGQKGQKGEIGAKGNIGQKGGTGSKGQKGEVGAKGITGQKGQKGEVGAKGITGDKGNTGSKGQKGEIGAKGSTGSKGQKGEVGAKGITGQKGQKGEIGAKGITGSKGQKGQTGSKGNEGNFGGATFEYDYSSTTTNSDPGVGNLRFNNTTLSSASQLYIDDSDDSPTDIQSFLRTIDDSTSTMKGHFRVSNRLNADDYSIFTISSISEQAGYFVVNCSRVSGSTNAFSNGEGVIITFARTGDQGQKGSTGGKGQKGEVGQKGQAGAKGQKGEVGAKGSTGSKGNTGQKGQKGQTGVKGNTGAKGQAGAKGQKGEVGQKGQTGVGQKGQKGSSADNAASAPSIASTSVVGETVEITISQSSTSGVTGYEVYSDGTTGTDYSLIASIAEVDIAATMSVVDVSYNSSGTVAYRVYAIKNGVYSSAGTATRAVSNPTLDVSSLSIVPDINVFHINYNLPESRFLSHVEIYVDAEAVQGNLNRTGAVLIYSGINSSFVYSIGSSDLDKYHQFWVECKI